MASHDKSDAQFYVALASVIMLGLITTSSVIADQFRGNVSQLSSYLVGGVISVASASAAWLFRNGNGNGNGNGGNGSSPTPAH